MLDGVGFRMRAVLVLALAGLATLGYGAPVTAHQHRVPGVKLRVNGQTKWLQPWSTTWSRQTGPNECVTQVGDGIPNFRPKVEVDHLHAKPRIVFRKRQRPRRVRAYADDRVSNGYPYDGKALDLTLRPRQRRGDRRVWVAKLQATVEDTLFVNVNARWQDRDSCGGGNASWDFALIRAG